MLESTVLLAYMDPGSGNMLVQLLAGGTAGIVFAARHYLRRLWHRIARRRS